jgi:cytidylate kinase
MAEDSEMAIITISKGSFSGVEALAERLSKELGYSLLSREEVLTAAAKEFSASQTQLESALSHSPGFLGGRGVKALHYVYCAQATMAKAVQGDNVVYHGQAGHLLLKGIPHQLRVRVVADMESRIERAMKECEMTRAKATEYVDVWDEKQDNWIKWVHGVGLDDPRTYDLTINLEQLPIASACATIAEMARRDFQTTPESQKLMDDLVLASEIRAKIGLDRGISDDRIQIEVADGVVTIVATARQLPSTEKIRSLALQLPGVKDVRSVEAH